MQTKQLTVTELNIEHLPLVMGLQSKIIANLDKDEKHFILERSVEDFMRALSNGNTHMIGVFDGDKLIAQSMFDFPQAGQGEHLESPAVSQYGPVPRDEAVETSCGLEDIKPRAQIQVISVAQDDFRPDIFLQIPVIYALYRPDSAYRHEDRCLDCPVVRGNHSASCTGLAVSICLDEFHPDIPFTEISNFKDSKS